MAENDWKCTGNVAEHTAWPRLRCVMLPGQKPGEWRCDDAEFIDDPKARGMDADELAILLARIMREGGDAFAKHKRLTQGN